MLKFFPPFALFCAAMSLVSCVAFPTRYQEKVSEVYISADAKKLLVSGKDFIYQLDMQETISKSLDSPFRNSLRIGIFKQFIVSKSGEIEGYFSLILSKDAAQQEKDEAIKMGYQTSNDGQVYAWSSVKGKRIQASSIRDVDIDALKLLPLSKEYSIEITDNENREFMKETFVSSSVILSAGIVIANPLFLLFSIPGLGSNR